MATTIRLSPRPANVRKARVFVAEQMTGRFPSDSVDAAILCTSELVTNVFLHARTDVTITVRLSGGTARVEVSDGSAIVPAVREMMDATATGGRGLRLVDTLTADWAVAGGADGKTVWFEVSACVDS